MWTVVAGAGRQRLRWCARKMSGGIRLVSEMGFGNATVLVWPEARADGSLEFCLVSVVLKTSGFALIVRVL